MAGKRQHYLPQFLLTGFASKVIDGASFCCVYRDSGKIFEAKTKHIGVENFFYGDPETEQADAVITDAEHKYAGLLKQLRSDDLNQTFDSVAAAEFVVHLGVRNRNIREELASVAERFVDGFVEHVSGPNNTRRMIINYFKENPTEVERLFRKEMIRSGVRTGRREYRQLLAQHKASLPSKINALPDDEVAKYAATVGLLKEHVRPSSKKGHNAAIAKDPAPRPRVEVLADYDWQLLEYSAHGLILSDVGPFVIGKSQPARALLFGEKGFGVVALPISHNRLLMGLQTGEKFHPEAEEVNLISASISKEFFVSSIVSDDRLALVEVMGSNRPVELEDISESKLRDL